MSAPTAPDPSPAASHRATGLGRGASAVLAATSDQRPAGEARPPERAFETTFPDPRRAGRAFVLGPAGPRGESRDPTQRGKNPQ